MLEQETPEFDFLGELPREAKAVAAVRDEVDDDVEFRELLEAQLAEAEEWARGERKHRKRLHHKLETAYVIYVLAAGNPKREALVQRRCDATGIAATRASHLTIRLVKLLLRPADKTVYQYAAALRYAALKKITVNDFASALEQGGGIAEFAERFWQKASKLSSDAADDSEDNDNASEEASGSGKHPGSKRRPYDQSAETVPEFEWNPKALEVYAEATNGDRVRQVSEKGLDGHWAVIKVRLLS